MRPSPIHAKILPGQTLDALLQVTPELLRGGEHNSTVLLGKPQASLTPGFLLYPLSLGRKECDLAIFHVGGTPQTPAHTVITFSSLCELLSTVMESFSDEGS